MSPIPPTVRDSMKSFKLIAVCALFSWADGLFAQQAEAVSPRNVAQLSASASTEVQQDVLTLSLTTARDGADAAAVQGELRQALDAALEVARRFAAVGQMDVRTGNFGLYPRHGKDGKINGWQGTTELVLKGRDFARLTSTAAKIQTLTLASVGFGLSPDQRTRAGAEAQSLAIERFKTQAQEVAKAFGFSGYSLREVSVNGNEQGAPPRQRMLSMAKADMAEAAVPVEAGKSTVTVTVSGSVQMK